MHKTTRPFLALAVALLFTSLFSGCSAKIRAAHHQHIADKYYAQGNYQKAEVEYLISIQWDGANAHNATRLADIYYEQGRFRRAFAYALKASELSTNDVDTHVKIATIYLMAHKVKEAREQAEYILSLSPTNSEAPILLAESVTSHTELEQIRARLDKLSKQIGNTDAVEVGYGILNFGAGDVKASEASLQRAIALNPTNSAAYFTLGNLNVAQRKMEEADAAFKKATDLSPVRSLRRLSYANFKIQGGELAEGKKLITEITDKAPDYLPAWLRQAEIALAEKRYTDCDGLLAQALARDNDNYDALLLRARSDLVQGKNEEAVTQLERMANLYDHSPDVFYYLAKAHLAANDSAKASSDLNKALFLEPRNPQATILLAGLNLEKNDTPAVINSMNDLIKANPGIAESYLMLANAYVAQKNFDQALVTYQQMAKYFPKSPQIPMMAGMVMLQQKRNADARKAFEKAIELAPHWVLAEEQLIDLDINENKFDTAIDRVNKEIAAEPKPSSGQQLLLAKIHIARANDLTDAAKKTNPAIAKIGDVPEAKNDINAAETALLKAVELDPLMPNGYLLLAKLYVSTGREQVALDRINSLLSKTNSPAAYMQLGAIQDMMKNYTGARESYEKVLATNPEYVPALNNLSYLYSERLGNLDKGYELADKAYQLASRSSRNGSHDPLTEDTLGWILFRKGDYQRALQLLSDSAGKMPKQPEIQLHYGLAQYMAGDENAARTALQTAASSKEDFAHKEEAAAHLAILGIDPKTADAKTRADLEKKLEDQPNDPVVASRLAVIYERDGSLDKAAKIYEQTLKRNPQNAQLMGRLARIYVNLNQSDKALDLAKQAHKLAPNDAEISLILGRLVFQSGDYNWAASLLQEAAPRLPNQPDVKYDLAWSCYSVGRVDDAAANMQSAATALSGGKQADAKQFLAMLAAAKAPTAAAAADAAQILQTNANYVPALMVSAVQAEQQNKPDDARSLYEKVLAKYPAFLPATRSLAILYAQRPADEQKAYDYAMKARAAYPDDARLARTLGILCYRRGDYSRAAQLLQQSSQNANKDGELLYYLGMAHYQLKQKSQSKSELTLALSLNLESQLAADARKTLTELK